jgi:endo-alpha-1,4-polygalactosaminidase (GH114 family)
MSRPADDPRARSIRRAVTRAGAAVALLGAGVLPAAWSATTPAQAPTASAAAQATTLQAERLRPAAGSGRIVRDASAGGRRALLLTGGGAARGRVRLPRPSRLRLVVRGTACRGAPRVSVTVDGTRVLSASVRSTARWATLRATPTLAAGTRDVSVRLGNARRTARCRRSLRVDRLVFTAAPAPTPSGPGSWWRPGPGTSWQWQLTGSIDTSVAADMYDIDLFDAPAATVRELHERGRHVVCYLDAGTYEPDRPDADAYPQAVLGAEVEGWPGERWLDIRRLDVLGPIIERRLDDCRAKGFDGVEPDNVDAYANDSGFPLGADDQLAFNRFLATAAHRRGLSVGLKNDLDQVAALEPRFDWALDEQCFQYAECEALRPFADAGKAVFIAEYELEPSAFCAAARAAGYSAIRKRLDLDAWREAC